MHTMRETLWIMRQRAEEEILQNERVIKRPVRARTTQGVFHLSLGDPADSNFQARFLGS